VTLTFDFLPQNWFSVTHDMNNFCVNFWISRAFRCRFRQARNRQTGEGGPDENQTATHWQLVSTLVTMSTHGAEMSIFEFAVEQARWMRFSHRQTPAGRRAAALFGLISRRRPKRRQLRSIDDWTRRFALRRRRSQTYGSQRRRRNWTNCERRVTSYDTARRPRNKNDLCRPRRDALRCIYDLRHTARSVLSPATLQIFTFVNSIL